jgi:hypothetical protein
MAIAVHRAEHAACSTPAQMRCLAVAALLSVCSCSFGMKATSPSWDGSTKPDCDDGYGAAGLDLAMSGTLVGGALAAVDQRQPVIGALAILAGAAYGVAAAHGYKKAETCRGQTAEYYADAAAERESREADARERRREREAPQPAMSFTPEPHGFCFSMRCYPTEEACEAARGPDGVGDCIAR